jgi:hypothetical protein
MPHGKSIVGSIALVMYLLIFTAGMLMDSAPYRSKLNEQPFSLLTFLTAMILFTPSNVGILTVLAGLIGGCTSNLTYSQAKATKGLTEDQTIYRTESPFASMFRSFLVYLSFMAGVFITANQPFENPTSEQYVRFAASVSLFAFVVGYDPTKFQEALSFLPKRAKDSV